MNTMKEKCMEKVAGCIQNIAMVTAKGSIGRSIAPCGYEVEIPEELLQEENK